MSVTPETQNGTSARLLMIRQSIKAPRKLKWRERVRVRRRPDLAPHWQMKMSQPCLEMSQCPSVALS